MWFRSLKRWQWAAIGLILGLLVGVSRVMSEAEEQLGGRGFVSQRQFLEAIRQPNDGDPYVKSIVIRPSQTVSGIDVVSFQALDGDTRTYKNYLFAAPRPFVVKDAPPPPSDDYSVRDYLSELSPSNPALSPQYAWWETMTATFALYGALGIAVLGGIWPILLRLIAGPDPSGPAYDLGHFHRDSAAPKSGAAISTAAADLNDFDEALEHALDSTAAVNVSETSESPVRPLSNAPLHPVPPPTEELKKDYAGQFYPVEKHAPHGFSLVELIIVMGMIALLMSFLMPSIRLARMHAQTAKCATQLRQIGDALHAYANDNHGWLPAWSDWHTWPPGLASDSYGPAWTIEMIPYLGKPDSPVYNCPSFPREQKYRNYFLESQWSGRSGKSAMKLTDITKSGLFVLSGDTTQMGHYPADVTQDDSDPDDFGGGMLVWPWTGGFYMHRGGNNVLFDDGHVALFSRYDKYQMTFNPHRLEDHDEVTPD